MARAHACPGCGAALTRIRPRPDPHYGLPLVHCPGCGAIWHRRRDPLVAFWSSGWKLARSLAVLGLQLLVLVTLAAGTVGIIDRLELTALPPLRTWWWRHELVLIVTWCMLTGTWLTAGLGHWPRWARWAGWLALLGAAQFIPLVIDTPRWYVHGLDPGRVLHRVWLLSLLVVAATPGIPIGLAARRLHQLNRRARFRRRRRRLRARGATA